MQDLSVIYLRSDENPLPVPHIPEVFRATTINYEQNIVWSTGIFTTKHF